MANNKVVFGDETLIDLSSDTVNAAVLYSGITAHNAAGEPIVGTLTLTALGAFNVTIYGSGYFFCPALDITAEWVDGMGEFFDIPPYTACWFVANAFDIFVDGDAPTRYTTGPVNSSLLTDDDTFGDDAIQIALTAIDSGNVILSVS